MPTKPLKIKSPLIASQRLYQTLLARGELSYLAPLGSEKMSAPYLNQCFFRGGGEYYPPGWVKHHASQSQDRNNKYFTLYIEFCISNKIYVFIYVFNFILHCILFLHLGKQNILCYLTYKFLGSSHNQAGWKLVPH
jgi:hypothetical protein